MKSSNHAWGFFIKVNRSLRWLYARPVRWVYFPNHHCQDRLGSLPMMKSEAPMRKTLVYIRLGESWNWKGEEYLPHVPPWMSSLCKHSVRTLIPGSPLTKAIACILVSTVMRCDPSSSLRICNIASSAGALCYESVTHICRLRIHWLTSESAACHALQELGEIKQKITLKKK